MSFNWGIRSRVLLVALLPMLVLAVLLTAFYTTSRLADLEEAYTARGKAFARQLAAASEYAVFSGNHDALQKLADASLGEEGVVGVAIFDLFGETLVRRGRLDDGIEMHVGLLDTPMSLTVGRIQRIVEPIASSQVDLDAEFSELPVRGDSTAPLSSTLGSVVLDLTRVPLDLKRRHLLLTGTLTVLFVLLGTLVLAVAMSRGVSGPIRQVARAVERIGQGKFDERVPIVGGGSLRTLAEGVNEMAAELAGIHEEMSQRIARATSELRARKEDAEQANMAKSRFLAAASHDLRQPMHALGLFIAELSHHELVPVSRHLLEQIAASAHAMEDLLDSLLDISRLDAGVLQPNVGAFALQPILNRIEAAQRPAAADAGLSLRVRASSAWGISDPVLFERILGNLVSNAVRYTRSGRILVACRRRGRRLRIEVWDSGIGIPAEAQTIIFQEFVQLQNPARSRGLGLGLGLAIVRRLTDMLDHPLELRSQPERGSVFAFEIPAGTAGGICGDDDPPRLPGDLAGLRIALVDDDPLALSAMQSLLSSWECEVAAAPDVESLLDILSTRTGPPQVIISDYRLGRSASGIEVIRCLRERYDPDLPAALITGDTGPESLSLAEAEGLAVLHKPVRPARLRALLNRITAVRDE